MDSSVVSSLFRSSPGGFQGTAGWLGTTSISTAVESLVDWGDGAGNMRSSLRQRSMYCIESPVSFPGMRSLSQLNSKGGWFLLKTNLSVWLWFVLTTGTD